LFSRRAGGVLTLVTLVLILINIVGVDIWPHFADGPPTPGLRVLDTQLIAPLTPTASGQLAFLAIAPNGTLVVGDRVGRRILRFDSAGRELSAWGPSLAPDVDLRDPAGIAAGNGTLYVLDRAQSWILLLDDSGEVKDRIDLRPFNLYGPNGLAVDATGTLYVADTGGNRLLLFGPNGQFEKVVGGAGSALGQLKQPMSVATSPDGSVLVADWENARIERWGHDLQATNAWPIDFRPWGVAGDALGRIYVPNTNGGTIDVLAPGGNRLAHLKLSSPENKLDLPSQVALSSDGSALFVLGRNGLLKISVETVVPAPTQTSDGGWVLLLGPLVGMLVGIGLGLLVGSMRVRRRFAPSFRSLGPWRRVVVPTPSVDALQLTSLAAVARHGPVSSIVADDRPRAVPESTPTGLARAPRIDATRRSGHAERAGVFTPGRRVVAFSLAAIVLVALLLRVVQLDTVPDGMHGDEGATGLEALRILHEGWIGVYSPLALGRPTGPLYLTAPSVALLGNSILSVRIAPALAGTFTVIVLFALLRRSLGATTALVGAAVLAVMNWHIHLSRVGFNLATWDFFVVLASWVLFEALHRGDWRWWLAAGVLSGAGVYTYQAHWLLLAIVGLFLATLLLGPASRQDFARMLRQVGGLGVAVVASVAPLVLWAADPANGYFNSFNLVSVFTKPAWQSLASPVHELTYLADRYITYWDRMCCHTVVDGVDGTGAAPLVPLLLVGLAGVGIVLALIRRRGPLVVLGTLIVLLAPIGAVVTIDGPARRSFALVPFLAMFAGVAVVELWDLGHRRSRMVAWLTRASLAGLLLVIAFQNLEAYFGAFSGSAGERWVFAEEVTDAARYMAALPPDSHVYFLSDRWSVKYETVRFLAKNVTAEDDSTEFGGSGVEGLHMDSAKGAPVVVLLGRYRRSALAVLESAHPGGTITTGGPPEDPTFVVYRDFR
jgi:4-amino-4-deoxy-L-arabinose transferase-like glycosyltransferase/sugar lactone lactonase YvrE